MRRTRGLGPRLLACFAVLAAAPAVAKPAILLFPVIGRPTQVTVYGRVLKEAPPQSSTNLSRNWRRLTAANWVGAPVEVVFGAQRVKLTSGHDGAFEVGFPAPASAPFPAGSHRVHVTVPDATAEANVEIVPDEAPFVVISDFDDTVAISKVVDKGAMLETALFADGETHPAVDGMAAFYRCLREQRPATPGFAFVTGSPLQFGPRLEAFFAKHQFPFAGLYLRNLGANTLSGYKQPILRKLLAQFPQKVILIGDNGEHDPEIYAEIMAEFPDRVLQVYIREAGGTGGAARVKGLLFKAPAEAARHAASRGLIPAECASRAFPAATLDAGVAAP